MRFDRMGQASNRNLIFVIVCLSIMVVVLSVCVILLLPNGDYADPNSNTTQSDNTTSNSNGGGNTVDNVVPTFAINTPYCEMRYPSAYSDLLEIKEFNENGIYTKQFLCTLSNGQHRLFAVHFGENANGDFFGYLITDDEKVSVYIECYEIPELETFSEDDQRTYHYMMDGINEVAKSISEASGYATH